MLNVFSRALPERTRDKIHYRFTFLFSSLPSASTLVIQTTNAPEGRNTSKNQPWLVSGGGYTNFAPAAPAVPLTHVAGGGSTGPFEFGGDINTRPFITLHHLPVLGKLPIESRCEVHDLYSFVPNCDVTISGGFQNQVAFTDELLLQF